MINILFDNNKKGKTMMSKEINNKHLLTITEIAEICGISRATAVRYKKEDDSFPSPIKFSTKSVRYYKEEVLTWIKNKNS